MGGCTNCAGKGGCDDRKTTMFAAMDAALARLYPTRTWGQLDDEAAFGAVDAGGGPALARRIAAELGVAAYFQRGGEDELCDYVYVLCMGREPSLWQTAAGRAPLPVDKLSELYLRVALSTVAPFAAVQQVLMELRPRSGMMMLTEEPRGGVFEPQLLQRMQQLVAVIGESGLVHLDFGDLTNPPEGFAPGGWAFGAAPALCNYFFFPQPPTTISTRYLAPA